MNWWLILNYEHINITVDVYENQKKYHQTCAKSRGNHGAPQTQSKLLTLCIQQNWVYRGTHWESRNRVVSIKGPLTEKRRPPDPQRPPWRGSGVLSDAPRPLTALYIHQWVYMYVDCSLTLLYLQHVLCRVYIYIYAYIYIYMSGRLYIYVNISRMYKNRNGTPEGALVRNRQTF